MAYQLMFTSAVEAARDTGENIFFQNLPADYKVYAFYYPGAMPDRNLESKLRELGKSTGNNLLVNIGKLNDPLFNRVVGKFEIKRYPVIIVTAIASLASPADQHLTAYARLDGKSLLDSSEKTIDCVQEVFSLFLTGKVPEGISKAKWTQRAEALKVVMGYFTGVLKKLGNYIANRDISFSLAEGKLELKKSGD